MIRRYHGAVPIDPPSITVDRAMQRPLRVTLTAEGAMYSPGDQYRLLDVARAADQAGADFVDVTEHVLMGLNALHSGQGWELHHLDMPQTEPLTTLAAMAGATQRIKLLSAIVIAPLRPAGLLAKVGATLHALSRGRFVMGVTASWQKDEYDALGVPFEQRGQILTDTIGACRALWRDAPASFHSANVNFDGMFCQPRPAPGEHIPVWFGGKFTPRQIRRVVELGDGWMPYGGLRMTLQQKADAIATLRASFVEAGRDPATLDICDGLREVDGSVARSLELIPAMAEVGINVFRVHLRRFARSPDDVLPVLEEVVRRFEEYRSLRA
jgi:probable F420-dependent oxidoreductase